MGRKGCAAVMVALLVGGLASEAQARNITGTARGDNLRGSWRADVIRGRAGNDRLVGGGGNDRLYGSSGNDRLTGGGGADRLFGGSGNDTLVVESTADRVDCGSGRDTLLAYVNMQRPSSCETLRFAPGTDTGTGTTGTSPPPPPPPTTVLATPLAGAWRGTISGTVAGQSFSLPLVAEIRSAVAGETNPLHLFLGTPVPMNTTVGYVFLTSALGGDWKCPPGWTCQREWVFDLTLKYMDVAVNGTSLRATLTNQHASEAAAVNGFTAPDVCAAAYGNMAWLYCLIPGPQSFTAREGSTVELALNGAQLNGRVRLLKGSSLIQMMPLPDFGYEATFTLNRA